MERMFVQTERYGGCDVHPCQHQTHTTVWDSETQKMHYITNYNWQGRPFTMRYDDLVYWITDNNAWVEVTPVDPDMELDEGI